MHFNLFCSNPSPHPLLMLLVWPVLTNITDIHPRIQPPTLGELGLCLLWNSPTPYFPSPSFLQTSIRHLPGTRCWALRVHGPHSPVRGHVHMYRNVCKRVRRPLTSDVATHYLSEFLGQNIFLEIIEQAHLTLLCIHWLLFTDVSAFTNWRFVMTLHPASLRTLFFQ